MGCSSLARRVSRLERPVQRAEHTIMVFVRTWDSYYRYPTSQDCIRKWPELGDREHWFLMPAKEVLDGEAETEHEFLWVCGEDDVQFRQRGLEAFVTADELCREILEHRSLGELVGMSATGLETLVRIERKACWQNTGRAVEGSSRDIASKLGQMIEDTYFEGVQGEQDSERAVQVVRTARG